MQILSLASFTDPDAAFESLSCTCLCNPSFPLSLSRILLCDCSRLLIQSSVKGHLGCFQFGVIMTEAAINICMQVWCFSPENESPCLLGQCLPWCGWVPWGRGAGM